MACLPIPNKGNSEMKKFFTLILGFILILSFCSCYKKVEIFDLTPETKNVNQSIVEYYRLKGDGEVEGTYFRAKMLECVKVRFDQAAYEYTSTVFLYRLAIVPKTTQLMKHFKIQVYPTNGIDVYLQNSGFMGKAPVQDLNMWLNSYPELDQTDITQIGAFELKFDVSNIADKWQNEQGISEAEYEKGMTTLRLEINCDDRKDTLILPFTGELKYITSEDDPLAISDPHVMNILREGSTYGYMGGLVE